MMSNNDEYKFGLISYKHLEEVSNNIGMRASGTESEKKAADYIVYKLKDLNYEPKFQPFTYKKKNPEGKETILQSNNIVTIKKGLSTREIIVGAHYDSVDTGRGADDNASSIAVMLEVIERIKTINTPYTIKFIAFAAEEIALSGSKYYVSKMSEVAIKNTLLMINMDSLVAGDIMYVYGGAGRERLVRDYIFKIASELELKITASLGENSECEMNTIGDWGDYAPFKRIGIPYLNFEATNWLLGFKDGYTQVDPKYGRNGIIWHTEYDCINYISKTFPGRIEEHLMTFSTLLYKILTEYKF
jgi:alkaline phosphatase isozyme conversion protein